MSNVDEQLDAMFVAAKMAYEEDRMPVVAELISIYVRHRAQHGYAWFLLGDSQRVLGLTVEAERALNRALENAPHELRWTVEARLGQLLSDSGKSDEAEALFARAANTADGKSCGWLWILRGANLAGSGLLESAERCHRHAAGLDGDRDEACLNLGYVLRAQGRYDDALEAFQQALAITPGYPKATEGINSLAGIEQARQMIRTLSESV